jgi:5-methylcytosine-specific restriction endonuclease McrA
MAGTPGVPRANGHRYRVARAAVLAASDTCWWCGHPGADQADHVVPRSVDPTQDVANPAGLAPIHGTAGCPYCPLVHGKRRRCNQERGDGTRYQRNAQRSRDW